MNPDMIIQLRQQLEIIREFERKNASSRFSYASYWGEFLVGVFFLGLPIVSRTPDSQFATQLVYYLFGVAFTFQGLYLIIRFKMDKRLKLLLEAMLSVSYSNQS